MSLSGGRSEENWPYVSVPHDAEHELQHGGALDDLRGRLVHHRHQLVVQTLHVDGRQFFAAAASLVSHLDTHTISTTQNYAWGHFVNKNTMQPEKNQKFMFNATKSLVKKKSGVSKNYLFVSD